MSYITHIYNLNKKNPKKQTNNTEKQKSKKLYSNSVKKVSCETFFTELGKELEKVMECKESIKIWITQLLVRFNTFLMCFLEI